MPKVDQSTAPRARGSDYPGALKTAFVERLRIRLGDAVGLTTLGVSRTTLPPGARSSLRHWHEAEDEMVFVLCGEVVLIDDTGETPLHTGEAAGFPAGDANPHTIANRSSAPAELLEIGTRPQSDRCHYGDEDLIAVTEGGATHFTTRAGALIEDET
ncbi:MAG: cupin domain-containing protein [Pseudomonadota bacterium]